MDGDLTGTRAGDETIAWWLVDGVTRTPVRSSSTAWAAAARTHRCAPRTPLRDPETGDIALRLLARIDAVTEPSAVAVVAASIERVGRTARAARRTR